VQQASIGYLNTLMIQDVLGGGLVALSAEDERALNPLFWSNIAAYGEVKLDMARRITLASDIRRTVAATGDNGPHPSAGKADVR
jgi:hypothetical protein